jgi:carboxyl-terminal processing protease
MPLSVLARRSWLRLLLWSVFLTGSALVPATAQTARWQDSPKVVLDQAWQIINQEYVDASFNRNNWQQARRELLARQYSSPQEAYSALRAMLGKLQDPYTRFMTPDQFEELTQQTSGETPGIGIELAQEADSQAVVIAEIYPGSPALEAGIRKGDRLLSVDDKLIKELEVAEIEKLIRGKPDTTVKLSLNRQGQGFDVSVKRADVEIPSVNYSLRREGSEQIGYLHLTQFTSHASRDMRKAIRQLIQEGATGFVLDLRGNPGGLLSSSIEIARLWIDEGVIVRTVDREGKSEELRANQSAITRLPLVVLVDRYSASSSEILSGALKDHDRATIVGGATFGKALVQALHNLSDGSGVAVTVAHYYTPKGTDINHTGIRPDVLVNPTTMQRRWLALNPKAIATMSDPAYAEGIGVLRNRIALQRQDNQRLSQKN